jgi:hypothetical protein
MLRVADFPQLQSIAWNRPNVEFIDEKDAFALYERNWPYVDQTALTEPEKALIERLIKTVGNGCFAHV